MSSLNYSDYLELKSPQDEKLFLTMIEPIKNLYVKHEQIVKSSIENHSQLYDGVNAFKLVTGHILTSLSSDELISFYNSLIESYNKYNLDSIEIITDTLLDISIKRNNTKDSTLDDVTLYKLFEKYNTEIDVLYKFISSFNDILMTLYEKIGLTKIQKKSILTSNITPLIKDNLDIFGKNLSKNNKQFVIFLFILKNDLEDIIYNSNIRFYSFFNDREKQKISNMEDADFQKYLANLAIENQSMVEAKKLGLICFESKTYLEMIDEIISKLNISNKDFEKFVSKKMSHDDLFRIENEEDE